MTELLKYHNKEIVVVVVLIKTTDTHLQHQKMAAVFKAGVSGKGQTNIVSQV